MSKTETDSKPQATAVGSPEGLAEASCSASVYDQVTRTMIVGHLCHAADQTQHSRLIQVANSIMDTMSRRKKPQRRQWSRDTDHLDEIIAELRALRSSGGTPKMSYDSKTYVDGVASHGLLCFGLPCDLQTWLDSPERIMRNVRDGMTAREINRSRWGSYVPVRVDIEELKACARRGLLRCDKGRWYVKHNVQAHPAAQVKALPSEKEEDRGSSGAAPCSAGSFVPCLPFAGEHKNLLQRSEGVSEPIRCGTVVSPQSTNKMR